MATPNYSYEKRQRELAKKRKKEEKAARKAAGLPPLPEHGDEASGEALWPAPVRPGAAVASTGASPSESFS